MFLQAAFTAQLIESFDDLLVNKRNYPYAYETYVRCTATLFQSDRTSAEKRNEYSHQETDITGVVIG